MLGITGNAFFRITAGGNKRPLLWASQNVARRQNCAGRMAQRYPAFFICLTGTDPSFNRDHGAPVTTRVQNVDILAALMVVRPGVNDYIVVNQHEGWLRETIRQNQ